MTPKKRTPKAATPPTPDFAAVRAECAARVDALEEFIALECDPTQFIGEKREWLIGLHRKHFPQNYAPEAQP